ncbi:hypothetical protein MMC18_001314 [Xylographa bjoerkii]|nr:hypothetical protein [Xylographa bjoerkii]
MRSILEALKLDSASRKTRRAQKAADAFEKAYDKVLDAEMEDILARGQAYPAPNVDSTSSESVKREKRIEEFCNRRSMVLAKKMIELKKRRLKKSVAHAAAFVTALGGTVAVTVASHGLLAPVLALPGAVLTWALADSEVERRKRKALKAEMRQPAPGALQLYLKEREAEDGDEDEDEEDPEEFGGAIAPSSM